MSKRCRMFRPAAHNIAFSRLPGSPCTSERGERIFKPAARRAGIQPIPSAHDLRHTAGAIASKTGMHPMAVKEMMGHSSIKVTYDVYGHLFPTMHEAGIAAVEESYRTPHKEAGFWLATGVSGDVETRLEPLKVSVLAVRCFPSAVLFGHQTRAAILAARQPASKELPGRQIPLHEVRGWYHHGFGDGAPFSVLVPRTGDGCPLWRVGRVRVTIPS
jgi:hypothetical protein